MQFWALDYGTESLTVFTSIAAQIIIENNLGNNLNFCFGAVLQTNTQDLHVLVW